MIFRRLLLGIFILFSEQSFASDYLFIENKGQWPEEIFYRVQVPSGYLWITSAGLKYQFFSFSQNLHFQKKENLKTNFEKPVQEVIMFRFPNQLKKPQAHLSSSQQFNFFLGNDPSKWVSGVNSYSEIKLENVFPNIDFRMYGTDQSLKYEYIVKPGGKVEDIKVLIEGTNDFYIKNQELLINTISGAMKEHKPFTFQFNKNAKQIISSEFELNKNTLSFKVGQYNNSESLIIDPELVFSTYSGSFSDNWSHTATYDSKGNLYAGGTAFGPDYPISVGVFQPKEGGTTLPGDQGYRTDVVITKYASDGKTILYSTFLGGVETEVPHSLVVNSNDELLIFGTTSSRNFPVSSGAFGREFKGGKYLNDLPITTNIGFFSGTDIFVSLISVDGKTLKGSTLMGGKENDGIHDLRALAVQNYGDEFRGEITVDSNDNVWVASVSTSDDFPTAFTTQNKKSVYDGVVFQLSPDLKKLLFSTYLGGNDYDAAYSIKVNSQNEIFVCGVTLSNNFPTTNSALKKSISGDSDAWVVKIKAQKIIASTFLGTNEGEIGNFLDIDADNNVYVLGLTTGDYPHTAGTYINQKSGQFVHCLNSNLSNTIFSSVFGSGKGIGKVDLVPTAFMVNNCGNIYVAGWGGKVNTNNDFNPNSTTLGLPVTDNAFRKTTTGSNYYLAIFEKGFKSLLYGTFFGSLPPASISTERGDHLDGGTCRFDKNGVIYHSACVCKANNGFVEFPLKNAAQPLHNSSNCNLAAFKFDLDALFAKFDLKKETEINPEIICAPATVRFQNKTEGGQTYDWYLNGKRISSEESIDYRFEKEGTFEVKLYAYNKITCRSVDSTIRVLKVEKFEYQKSNDTTVCEGATVNLWVKGGLSYEWSPGEGLTNNKSPNISAKVDSDKIFTVKIINEKCSISENISVKVANFNEDFKVSPNATICKGNSIVLKADGQAERFVWSSSQMADSTKSSITVRPAESKTYFVRAFYENGCQPSASVKVNIDASVALDFDYEYQYECFKPSKIVFKNLSKGGSSFSWTLGNQPPVISDNYPDILANKDIVLNMVLKSGSKEGCEFVFSKPVEIFNWDGVIPNVITPNNDKKNDTFVIGYPNCTVEIYNNWGKRVFHAQEYKNDWGADIANGTYYYLIKIPGDQQCKGWIEVID